MPVVRVAEHTCGMAVSLETDVLVKAASGKDLWVLRRPARFAVFGGGLTTEKEACEGVAPASMRDAFLRWMRSNAPETAPFLLCPESFGDWNHFNRYEDLLRFEEDLGHVTSAILIFLEGVGSIAELGAFCQTSSLSPQLIVVVTQSHHPKQSFISLGPLKKLENANETSVIAVPDVSPSELDDYLPDIVTALMSKGPADKVREQYREGELRHQLILVLDLVTMLRSVSVAALKEALDHFQLGATDHRLRQLLYTLESARLIARKKKGNTLHFEAIHADAAWIHYGGSEKSFHRARVQAKIDGIIERERKMAADKALSAAREFGRLAA